MHEAMKMLHKFGATTLEKRMGSYNVVMGECEGVAEGVIHVGLGSKVDDCVGSMTAQDLGNIGGICNIANVELIPGGIAVLYIFHIRTIVQSIDIDNLDGGMGGMIPVDEVRADESAAAGHQ